MVLHSTPPSLLTAHMNMTSASFWPFLTRSRSSIRLISAVGPCPINTGRNIGSPAAGAEGVALPCDHARSTIEKDTIKKNANARMGKYASEARRFFKRKTFRHSERSRLPSRSFIRRLEESRDETPQ